MKGDDEIKESPEFWQAITDGVLAALDAAVSKCQAELQATACELVWNPHGTMTIDGKVYTRSGAASILRCASTEDLPEKRRRIAAVCRSLPAHETDRSEQK